MAHAVEPERERVALRAGEDLAVFDERYATQVRLSPPGAELREVVAPVCRTAQLVVPERKRLIEDRLVQPVVGYDQVGHGSDGSTRL